MDRLSPDTSPQDIDWPTKGSILNWDNFRTALPIPDLRTEVRTALAKKSGSLYSE